MSADAAGTEETTVARLRFDGMGLVTVVVEDAATNETLMLAHANPEAVRQTLESRYAWFWSRSRGKLWCKGETSSNRMRIVEVLVDCDQDALLYRVSMEGAGAACHTGRRSCFYRSMEGSGELSFKS